jgi:hypothetical protein
METGKRRFLLGSLGGLLSLTALGTSAATATRVTVYKNPSCGCCGGWVEHMKSNGFEVRVIEVADVAPHRQRLGVPEALGSCHTAEVGGYAIEGHVPAADVRRLLRERPKARGLAVPAMVPGSPGMSGAPVAYATLIFDASGKSGVFERH